MSPPSAPAPITIHAESARIGIRVALHHMTGTQPSEDRVHALMQAMPAIGALPADFPLAILEQPLRERMERRRIYALKAMEIMMHHAGDSTLITSEQIRDLASKAWSMAAAMESEEGTARQLDSIGRV